MLRERDAEGARTKAITLPDESLAISRELGMRPLMERVLSRRSLIDRVPDVTMRRPLIHSRA